MSHVHLASDIYARIKASPKLRAVPVSKLRLFCVDLALVVFGVRTAYLLDVFAIDLPDVASFFGRVLNDLHEHIPMTKVLLHVYEPTSGQSFFVNRPLLDGLSKSVMNKASGQENDAAPLEFIQPSFIHLTDPTSVSTEYSPGVSILLGELGGLIDHAQEPSFSLTEGHTQEVLVPLAAILLEYPVAYVPSSSEQSDFLENTPLDVYEYLLTGEDSKQHQLLKFSCPSAIGSLHPRLSPHALMLRMKTLFERRLGAAGIQQTLSMTHHVETHARVAL
ncbi:hypothetical protein DENSPDRAFT_648321 [Dentipellis sp. KUC8613]|nr:hypothetical protein DENSPDRAFT_648321 [Dentipellis sp. KUC8613]